ncbi:hypothetical protein DFJ74DRAFT_5744 [Hyaloraphidium curvatum]|nr:hypothetical protein DFJ74DRAFT_5744 [Hyaloraphidium curvatum]
MRAGTPLRALAAVAAVLLLASTASAQRPDNDPDGDGRPGRPSRYDPGTNATSCALCRAGGDFCPKQITIPAWFSHSITVTGPERTFNVWNWFAATDDPTDDLHAAIVDPAGNIYSRTYNTRDSCQAEVNFRTQENRNRLVLKCDNWFFSCRVNLQYSVNAATTSGTDAASGSGSDSPVAAPSNQTAGETGVVVASAANQPSGSTSPSAAVIGLSVGLGLLAAALVGLGAFFLVRKRKKDKEAKRNAAIEQATNLSPDQLNNRDVPDVLALSPVSEYPATYPGEFAYDRPAPPTPAPSYSPPQDMDYRAIYGYDPREYGFVLHLLLPPRIGAIDRSRRSYVGDIPTDVKAPARGASMTGSSSK